MPHQLSATGALGVLGLVLAACGAAETSNDDAPLVPPSQTLAALSGFAGDYVIIDARRASDVAAPAMFDYQPPIGESLSFTQSGIELEGAACDDWTVTPSDDATLSVASDPNLIDTILGPTDSPISSGDRQVHQGYIATCEDEEVFRFHKVDDRVLIMPTENSAINLILERPLTELQIKAYQAQLKSMKFYDGELTGTLDDVTLRSSRIWYEDRARLDDTQPVPQRPAITENLLDALNVLSME